MMLAGKVGTVSQLAHRNYAKLTQQQQQQQQQQFTNLMQVSSETEGTSNTVTCHLYWHMYVHTLT